MTATYAMPATIARTNIMKPAQRKILLVDDDPGVRQILHRLLMDEDYLVFSAANGAEALRLAETTEIDLVLLDLNMPVKNGWETFEQFSIKNPLLPIILITARVNQFFPALAAGVGALMEKPLDFVKLFHTIQDLLDEPEDARVARSLGRPAAFHHVPSKTGSPLKEG
ncbi:MAG TPA: response regulator [Verrucomicrobiae bacterium]|nr:response regulator [Verrucomicrobiae bacterium]